MDPPADVLPTADEVRRENARLDRELLALFERTPPERIHEDIGDEWTVAHNLAHIAEFPGYFAHQLDEWISGDRVVMGRVAEHDADRNDALARAPQRTWSEMHETARRSFAELESILASLRDDHITASTRNVKYGEEPLHAYLGRYVVGHKAAHVEQLRAALDALRT